MRFLLYFPLFSFDNKNFHRFVFSRTKDEALFFACFIAMARLKYLYFISFFFFFFISSFFISSVSVVCNNLAIAIKRNLRTSGIGIE